jgi:muconolactone delta-isomerase
LEVFAMRVAIIYRPKSPPPQEALPELLQRMGGWVEKYSNRISPLEFFVAGGGYGVIDVDDSAELHRILAEHPFTPFADVEIRPVLSPAEAMANLREAAAARAAG